MDNSDRSRAIRQIDIEIMWSKNSCQKQEFSGNFLYRLTNLNVN